MKQKRYALLRISPKRAFRSDMLFGDTRIAGVFFDHKAQKIAIVLESTNFPADAPSEWKHEWSAGG
jgi:hypothetical protein